MWFAKKAKAVKVKAVPVARRPVRASADNSDLDFGGLGQAIWYKRWHILVPTLIAAALAFVTVNVITPRYKSEARVLLENKENVFLRADSDKNLDRTQLDPEGVASQIQLVMSRDLARDVIRREGLANKAEFDPLVGGASLTRTLMGLVGISRDPLGMSAEERVLESYYDRLNVFAVDKTRVIVIEFSSADPELAARVANTIADNYFSMQQSAKQTQTRAASGWLSNEIASMRAKVAEAEMKIEEYRAKSNLYVGSNNSSLPNQQLTEVNSQISAARAQKADLEARASQLRELLKSGRTIDSSDVANSESMRRLTDQRTALRSQLAEQSSTLLDQHPRIKELRAQLGELDAQIRAEGDRLARAMDNDARVAGNRIEALTASLDQVKKMASQSNEQDLQLRAMEREGKAQRDLLESYLAKYREASARDNINAAPADARVISRASPAVQPSFPKKGPIVLIVSLAVMLLQTVFIVTGELLSPSMMAYPALDPVEPEPVRAPEPDLSPRNRRRISPKIVPKAAPRIVPRVAARGAPQVAATPRRPVRAAAQLAPSADFSVQSFDQVVASLREAGDAGRRVAVIGSGRNVGTTYTSIQMARALARDSRVVLVDLDFNSPNLAVISSDENAPGIADLAHGTVSFGDIITADKFSAVHIVAAGNVGGDPASVMASETLPMTIDALAQAYDYVLLDAGAADEIETGYLAALAPFAVLVSSNPATSSALAGELGDAGFLDVVMTPGGAHAAAA
jgi:uncharacterized protein involved in exopolysaccharide biosynthesis/Mrp family chromosome partitioning ATPase